MLLLLTYYVTLLRTNESKQWKDNMAALAPYFDVIVELLNQKRSYSEISALLCEEYGLERGASERSIRQFAKENNINPQNLGKEEAKTAVADAVREV